MNDILRMLLAGIIIALPVGAQAMDNEYVAGALTVKGLWARVTLQNRPAGGFVTIHNKGDTADKIVSASSDAADRVELHTNLSENGIMKMRQIKSIDIPANSMVELKSGGIHMMIFGLKKPFKPGDMIPLTLTFENAGPVDMHALVQSMKAGSEMKMDHDKKPSSNTN